jgi:hypothetical protein
VAFDADLARLTLDREFPRLVWDPTTNTGIREQIGKARSPGGRRRESCKMSGGTRGPRQVDNQTRVRFAYSFHQNRGLYETIWIDRDQNRGLFAYIRIAINSHDPNPGAICKCSGAWRAATVSPPAASSAIPRPSFPRP